MIAGLQRAIEILKREKDTSPVPEVFDNLLALLVSEIDNANKTSEPQ